MKSRSQNVRRRALVDTVFRIMSSLIFVTAGWGHLAHPQLIVKRLVEAPIGAAVARIAPAYALVIGSGAVLLAAGFALLLGARTRLAAVALMACLIPITVSVQLAPGHMGPLFKNIALFGMLLHFASAGAAQHAFSLDRLWMRRRTALQVAEQASS